MKWVTREKAKVDRIACPWLIKKFVDKNPEFLFVPPENIPQVVKETGAIPYDAKGIELTHYREDGKEYVSFDAIIKKYKLKDPPNQRKGGFDHAAVHIKSGTLYVAHTSNDAVDVIDSRHNKYLHSIPDLPSVAGVLVSNEKDLVFTSNRGEKTVGVFLYGREGKMENVKVGGFHNGLAFDHSRDVLLVAIV